MPFVFLSIIKFIKQYFLSNVMKQATADTLIKSVEKYLPNLDKDLLKKACDFSRKAHGDQKRASGDPYYLHPLIVSHILADLKMDFASIITGLLHDTVEDTDVTLEEIEELFGSEVATLVDGVTKLTKIEYQSENTKQAENFRKLLLAMSEDIRVLLVKLADRLHNMRTLQYIKSPEKRKRIAHETMDIYSALAERIGMQKIKNELQDLSFSELHPEMRDSVVSRLEYLRKHGMVMIDGTVNTLQDLIKKEAPDIKSKVSGREKTACSIWRKMQHKNVTFEQLSDIIAFRIVTETIYDCYRILGIIHSHYQVVPDSFKDFISTPKQNGYQSLHTVVLGPQKHFIEVQIRTQEMQQIAEFGVAAHWSYKQKEEFSTDGKQYRWIRELLYILEHANDSEEFLENTKLEMHYNQVFCFTPKGKLIALPKGATPVDFAYLLHSSIGNHCAGAKVNGRIVPLQIHLKNGDQVEIITSKTQNPSPSWEKFIVTGKAQSAVRRFIRGQKRNEYTKLGKSMLQKMFKDEGLQFSHKRIRLALDSLNKKSVEDVFASVGEGNITTNEVFEASFAGKAPQKEKRSIGFNFLNMGKKKDITKSSLAINGLIPGVAMSFADCCHPIPGDYIIGVMTTGQGVTIHTTDCKSLSNFAENPERLLEVSWGEGANIDTYVASIKLTMTHEAGSLATIANCISNFKANINNLQITNRQKEFFELIVDVIVKGESQLDKILQSLHTEECIQSAKRYKK